MSHSIFLESLIKAVKMPENELEIAQIQIFETLKWSEKCTRQIGIEVTDVSTNTFCGKTGKKCLILLGQTILFLLVLVQLCHIIEGMVNGDLVYAVLGIHITGYGMLGLGKWVTLQKKQHVIKELVYQLAEIWPVHLEDPEAVKIKRSTLLKLRIVQACYIMFNISGILAYTVFPFIQFLVMMYILGKPADLGYAFFATYPFDKTKPVYHEISFVFESVGGTLSVFSMLGSDVMFISMASHISMLLRLLQIRIGRITSAVESGDGVHELFDCSQEAINVIKVHQRLIKYSEDLEDAFTVSNFINILMSSVNICCVTFNIVLIEPVTEYSNKLFLAATLTQVFLICWYADEMYRSSLGVSDAVYKCDWFKCNNRCRRIFLLMIVRSQKALCFTALKFSSITIATFTSILTTSYSYFTLLYTMYSE